MAQKLTISELVSRPRVVCVMAPRNYQLYTRILRLTHLLDPCRGADGSDLNDIVRVVILPDTALVWC